MTSLFLHSHLAFNFYQLIHHQEAYITQYQKSYREGQRFLIFHYLSFFLLFFNLFSDGLVKMSQIITMHVETLLKYLHQSYEIVIDSKVIEVQNKVYRIIFSEHSIFSPYSIIQKLIKSVKYQPPLSFFILHFSCLYFSSLSIPLYKTHPGREGANKGGKMQIC